MNFIEDTCRQREQWAENSGMRDEWKQITKSTHRVSSNDIRITALELSLELGRDPSRLHYMD